MKTPPLPGPCTCDAGHTCPNCKKTTAVKRKTVLPDHLRAVREAVNAEFTREMPDSLKPDGGRLFSELDDTGAYRCHRPGGEWITVHVRENRAGTAYETWGDEGFLAVAPPGRYFGPLSGRWIPDGWGAPDENLTVLCFDTVEGSQVIGYLEEGKWWSDYSRVPIEVSHWQPLPDDPS